MIRIELVDYDPDWPRQFDQERQRILAEIGELVIEIEHIGSTAVPGLAAKPVIDIMIGVDSLARADDECIQPIVGLGYEYVKAFEQEMPERRFFRRDSPVGRRSHQIHLVEIDTDWWERHLAFRDYLRDHAQERRSYEAHKRQLATREYETTSDYAEAKTEFIRAVETKALASERRKP